MLEVVRRELLEDLAAAPGPAAIRGRGPLELPKPADRGRGAGRAAER